MRDRATRLTLGIGVAVCIGGCGSQVCDEAYSKMNACVQKLDCNKLGPLERTSCEQTRKAWGQVTESTFKLACDQSSAEAEKIVACSLDPRTCKCPGS